MQQIYRRTPMPKCNFNKVAKQLYWNHTSAWVFSCKFAAYFQNTFSQEHLWTADSTNCSQIKLVIYQFAFCCFFFWSNGWLFKRSILISLFVVNFRKVLKHFLNLNTAECISTVLIKNASILHFNRLYVFWLSWLCLNLNFLKF